MSGQKDKHHRAHARLAGPLLLVMWMALGLQCSGGDDDQGFCGDGQLDPGEDNESLTINDATEGWHYVDVYGKCTSDLNYYTVSFTLNP